MLIIALFILGQYLYKGIIQFNKKKNLNQFFPYAE